MKKLISVLSLVMIALCFQNCGTNLQVGGLTEGESLLAQQEKADQIVRPPVGRGEIPVLEILKPENLKVRFHGRHGEYEVDLQRATAFRHSGANQAKVVYNAAIQKRFLVALTGAQLCEQDPKSLSPDLACLMIAGEPYARLETKGSSMDLGASTSSCTWVQDLCGRKREELRQAIQAFIDVNENLSVPYTGGIDQK